jgi:hypothetical protein
MRTVIDRIKWVSFLKVGGLAVLLLALCLAALRKPPRPLSATDFSRSNSVSVTLGVFEKEHSGGIKHVYWEKDGLTKTVELQGEPCRVLSLEERNLGYVYFIIDTAFKRKKADDVMIDVEYFDDDSSVMFGIEYDATGLTGQRNAAYTHSKKRVRLAGSGNWETARFQIENAAFRNSQNSLADFRVWVSPPKLYVRSVTVTRR